METNCPIYSQIEQQVLNFEGHLKNWKIGENNRLLILGNLRRILIKNAKESAIFTLSDIEKSLPENLPKYPVTAITKSSYQKGWSAYRDFILIILHKKKELLGSV